MPAASCSVESDPGKRGVLNIQTLLRSVLSRSSHTCCLCGFATKWLRRATMHSRSVMMSKQLSSVGGLSLKLIRILLAESCRPRYTTAGWLFGSSSSTTKLTLPPPPPPPPPLGRLRRWAGAVLRMKKF